VKSVTVCSTQLPPTTPSEVAIITNERIRHIMRRILDTATISLVASVSQFESSPELQDLEKRQSLSMPLPVFLQNPGQSENRPSSGHPGLQDKAPEHQKRVASGMVSFHQPVAIPAWYFFEPAGHSFQT